MMSSQSSFCFHRQRQWHGGESGRQAGKRSQSKAASPAPSPRVVIVRGANVV